MNITRVDYDNVPYSVMDIILEWDSTRSAYACAVLEFGKIGDYVYLGHSSDELVAIALVSPGDPNILQFLAAKKPGCGKIFLECICRDCKYLALHAMNESRGFYDKCGFTHIRNGNYTKGGD